MRIGIGNTIPERVSLPGQSGGGVVIPNEFIFEVNAAIGDTIDLRTKDAGSAADFVINWGEGSDETINAETASHTYTSSGTKVVKINKAGTNTPVSNFAVFSSNQGKSMVTKISNWGTNPWAFLNQSFENCINLTTIEPSAFKGSTSGVNLIDAFKGCTSLTSLDLTDWDLTHGCGIESIVQNCSNLAFVNKPSKPIKLTIASRYAFNNVGNSLTNGCEFNLEGLDFSTSTLCDLGFLFENSRISPSSSFANWVFNSSINNQVIRMFKLSDVTGVNSTLDLSGWTTLNTNSFYEFAMGLNSRISTATNLTINLSNLNVSNSNSFYKFFGNELNALHRSKVERIIGLNTWPDLTTSGQDLEHMFSGLNYCKLDSDQLSDSFRSSLTPSTMREMFHGLSKSRAAGDRSAAPVLDNIDLSSSTTSTMIYRLFENAKLSSAFSFDNVTFPTTQLISFSRVLFGTSVSSNDLELDFSSKTMRISNLQSFGYNLRGATKLYFGDNVDLSSCTSMSSFVFNAGGASSLLDVKLPTNADYGNVTSWNNAFVSFDGVGPFGGLTTCVTDTLIRRLYETSLNSNQQLLNISNSQSTGSPSVVNSNVVSLSAAGWTIQDRATDAVMPFVYTAPITQNIAATPTGSFTGGTFSSNNSNIAVDATTGVINTPNFGNTTIRYTLADGCYNEQAIVVESGLAQVNNVYSMSFDGSSDYIDLGDSDDLSFGDSSTDSPFSISMWGNITNGVNFRGVQKISGSTYEYRFNTLTNGVVRLNLYDSNASNFIGVDGGSLTSYAGQWIHLVATYDGSSSSAGCKIYLNGSPLSTTPSSLGSYTAMHNTTAPVEIGRLITTYTNGLIDEVAIFNVELTAQEVQNIYNATETGKTADLNDLTTPPVKWYRMGD